MGVWENIKNLFGRPGTYRLDEADVIKDFIKRNNARVEGDRTGFDEEFAGEASTGKETDGFYKSLSERFARTNTIKERIDMAEDGICLPILVYDPSPLVRLAVAQHGYGLDKLVDDEAYHVRAEVARQGYGLDVLVHDEEPIVRAAVAEYDQEWANENIKETEELSKIYVSSVDDVISRAKNKSEERESSREHQKTSLAFASGKTLASQNGEGCFDVYDLDL